MPKRLKNRPTDLMEEIDRQSGGGPMSKEDRRSARRPPKSSDEPKVDDRKATYEDDFGTEAEIADLKKEKEELLKGISGKSEAEKKKIRKQLKELNDRIMDLESN